MSEIEMKEQLSPTDKPKAKRQPKANNEIQELKAEIDNLKACLEHIATHTGAASILAKYGLTRYTITKEDMKRVK